MAGTGRWEEGGGGEKKERAGGTERQGQGGLFALGLLVGQVRLGFLGWVLRWILLVWVETGFSSYRSGAGWA